MAQTHSLDLELSSSQYASIADASQTGLDLSDALTFEAWIRLESVSATEQMICSKFVVAGQRCYYWAVTSSTIVLSISTTGNNDVAASVSWSPLTGVWYHLAVTKTGTTVKFYVNGKQQGADQTLAASAIFDAASPFSVGCYGPGTGNFFDGLVKDVRVFNDVRTAGEIASDARTENVSDANLKGEWNFNNAYTDSSGNGNTLTSGNSPTFSTTIPWDAPSQGSSLQAVGNMVSWWTMDETSGTRADAHGSNDLTDNNTVGSDTGKWSNAASFTRTNSESLSITDAAQTGLDLTGDISVALWMKPTATSLANACRFVAKYNGASDHSYLFSLGGLTNGDLHVLTSDDGSTNAEGAVTPSPSFSAGTFYHVVFSYDASVGSCAVFVNGVSQGTITGLDTSVFNGAADFVVGARTGADYMDGLIDELSIYNTALDYGAVLDLYAAGAGIPYSASAGAQLFSLLGVGT